MFKKFLFIFLSFLVLLLLLLFLLVLNINYLLNNLKTKTKLLDFLKENYHIELKYEKININLLKKSASVKNLFFKSSRYEIFLPEGKFIFSLYKFLKFNFIPEKLRIKNGYLKIYRGKRYFKHKNFIHIISNFSPIYLDVSNTTLNYETSVGWINLKDLNLKLKIDKHQALYEATSKGNFFQKVVLKGRFDYKNLFSENFFTVNNLDLSYFKKIANYGVLKTSIDVKSEIVLEKNTLNIAFVFHHPYLYLKKIPSERLLKGYLEGLLVYNKSQLKISLDHLIIDYPKIKGSLNLIKNKEGYHLVLNAKELNFSDIKHILTKVFPENKKLKKFFAILNKGNFYNITLKTTGKSLKDVFRIENLSLRASLNRGKVKIAKLPFDFKNIQGDLIFKNKTLFFKGNATINKNTTLEVKKLDLDFKKKPLKLFIEGNFNSSAKEFINIVTQFLKKPKYFKEYKFKGNLKGNIILTGKIPKMRGKIKVYPENVTVKVPYYKNLIFVKDGVLSYDFNKLSAKNLKISTDEVKIESLKYVFNLKTFDLSLIAKNIHFSQSFIKEIGHRSKKIKDLINKYHIAFNRANIEYLKYRDNLSYLKESKNLQKNYFYKNIVAKGDITDLTFNFPYKKENFNLSTEKLSFIYQNGKLSINKTLINLENSVFEVEGKISLKKAIIQGKGRIEKGFKNKLEKLFPAIRKISINTPIEFNQFKLIYENGTYYYSGNHSIEGFNILVNLDKSKKHLKLNLVFLNKDSDFRIQFKKISSQGNLRIKGRLDLKYLSKIFTLKNSSFSGKLEASLNLNVPKKLEIKNFSDLANFYLNFKTFLHNNYLKLSNFKYFSKGTPIFSLNLEGNFTDEKLKISKFTFKWDSHQIKGLFEVKKNKNYLYLNGNIIGKKVDFRKFIKKKKKSKKSKELKDIFSIFDNIPLVANLRFQIDELILPTSHRLQKINGEISFDNINKLFIVKLPEFHFCDLSLQAMYKKTSDAQYTLVKILPSKGDFLDLFSCLYPKEMPEVIIEGPYTLKGYFYAEGNRKSFIKKGVGAFEVHSHHGYIYRAPLLARIFAYLSPIDLFRGKVPNLENKLLEYEELDIKAVIDDTTLKIDDGFLSAIGFRLFSEGNINLSNKKINLTFYISPFKTVDVVIEKIPYLGKLILGKTRMLIYLPLEVTGTYKKYKIIPLHPSSVGKGVFDFIFRIFGIPEEFYKETTHINKESKE